MQTQTRTATTPIEALGISALCFGWFIVNSLFASAGFGSAVISDQGSISLMAIEAYLAILAVSVLHSRGFSVESLYPIPTVIGAGLGLLLYFAAAAAAESAVRPFAFALQGYEDPMNRMMANARVSLPTMIAFGVINGAYEEVFLLGFLMRGLRRYGLTVALGSSLLVRVLYHTYMGPLGVVWVLVFGAVLSVYFIESGKLFPAVFAHAIADTVPFLWR